MLQVDDIPPEQHALVPSFMGGGGKRIHPLPFSDPNLPGNSSGLVLYFPTLPSFHLFAHYLPRSGSFHSLSLFFFPFCFAVQPRSMDPSRDLAAYGYGSVAWKERMENWKQKQEKLQMMKNENGGKDWDNDGDGPELPL